jgi:hypothetical protein
MPPVRVAVDLSQGIITLAEDGTDPIDVELLFRQSPGASTTPSVHLGNGTIDGVEASISASRTNHAFHVSLTPPDDLSFSDRDKRSGEIISALSRAALGRESRDGEYKWGRVRCLWDWRDGGWGAHFTFYR